MTEEEKFKRDVKLNNLRNENERKMNQLEKKIEDPFASQRMAKIIMESKLKEHEEAVKKQSERENKFFTIIGVHFSSERMGIFLSYKDNNLVYIATLTEDNTNNCNLPEEISNLNDLIGNYQIRVRIISPYGKRNIVVMEIRKNTTTGYL